jgi:hypothetical protein
MAHVTRPLEAEPETLLRNVTLVNHYQDRLMFLEIRGTGSRLTACFDNAGDPTSGDFSPPRPSDIAARFSSNAQVPVDFSVLNSTAATARSSPSPRCPGFRCFSKAKAHPWG